MKITRRQLRRIIKEERAKLVNEGPQPARDPHVINMVKDILIDLPIKGAVSRGEFYILDDIMKNTDLSGGETVAVVAAIAREMGYSEMSVQEFEDSAMALY